MTDHGLTDGDAIMSRSEFDANRHLNESRRTYRPNGGALRPRPLLQRMAEQERRERNARRTVKAALLVVALACVAVLTALVTSAL